MINLIHCSFSCTICNVIMFKVKLKVKVKFVVNDSISHMKMESSSSCYVVPIRPAKKNVRSYFRQAQQSNGLYGYTSPPVTQTYLHINNLHAASQSGLGYPMTLKGSILTVCHPFSLLVCSLMSFL